MLIRICMVVVSCALFSPVAFGDDARPGTLRFAVESGALSSLAGGHGAAGDVASHRRVSDRAAGVVSADRLLIGFEFEGVGGALASQLGFADRRGFVVTRVTTATARGAGLERFDVIRFVDGVVATDETLDEAKARAQAGGEVVLGVYRRGSLVEVPVEVVLRH